MFDQGDLKLVILRLLDEKPRHGYEIIKALEDRSGGRYTPSAGAVYPTLTMLEDLGYAVDRLAAGVARRDGGFGPPFDHLTLRVHCTADGVDGAAIPWLADVGFGDSFLTPLHLDTTGEQPDGRRAYRLDRDGDARVLWQRDFDGAWTPQHRFDLTAHQMAEYEPTCLYHQTSPQSSFTQRRVCTLATADGRVTLAEGRLITTRGDSREEHPVAEEERAAVLRDVFGVRLG